MLFTGDNYLVVKRASGKKGAGWLRARAVTGIFQQTNFSLKSLLRLASRRALPKYRVARACYSPKKILQVKGKEVRNSIIG